MIKANRANSQRCGNLIDDRSCLFDASDDLIKIGIIHAPRVRFPDFSILIKLEQFTGLNGL